VLNSSLLRGNDWAGGAHSWLAMYQIITARPTKTKTTTTQNIVFGLVMLKRVADGSNTVCKCTPRRGGRPLDCQLLPNLQKARVPASGEASALVALNESGSLVDELTKEAPANFSKALADVTDIFHNY
jgi:hypothetical protein